MRTRARASGTIAVVVFGLALTACGPNIASEPTGSGRAGDSAVVDDDVPSALDDPDHPDFPAPLFDLEDLISGGPPPDGIPPIDDPDFQPASEVDWLDDTEPVLSLTVNEETRAYPLQVMTWHEIVNDTVGGTPVAVTYCPLCNSGVAFVRELDGRLLDFGTSGMLHADNLVMYDRQTESLWPQLTGTASVGALTGSQLEAIPMGVVGWGQFRATHADAQVLTRDTGFERDYGRNPYVRYDNPYGGLLAELPEEVDDRLLVKERVVGIRIGDDAVAVTREDVAAAGVLPITVGGRDLVVLHAPGQASALDAEEVSDGVEIGSVGVFEPRAQGRRLTLSPDGGEFVDDQTGSRWSILGEAVSGPLDGARLPAVTHLDTFWFAWVSFQPDTRLE